MGTSNTLKDEHNQSHNSCKHEVSKEVEKDPDKLPHLRKVKGASSESNSEQCTSVTKTTRTSVSCVSGSVLHSFMSLCYLLSSSTSGQNEVIER